jgi:hypothetical protein
MVPNKKVGARGRPDFSGENNSGDSNSKAKYGRDAGDASTNPRPLTVDEDDESII